jgi:hypothetical protein
MIGVFDFIPILFSAYYDSFSLLVVDKPKETGKPFYVSLLFSESVTLIDAESENLLRITQVLWQEEINKCKCNVLKIFL